VGVGAPFALFRTPFELILTLRARSGPNDVTWSQPPPAPLAFIRWDFTNPTALTLRKYDCTPLTAPTPIQAVVG
jgi:hypothetical protein